METPRFRECLEEEFGRLRRAVVLADAAAPVPSCPEWRVVDLARHVAEVYQHKTESMRRGESPQPWPPDLTSEEPLALLDRSYRELVGEFDARPVDERTAHWYQPDSTVGCLLRRMAQETVIHRVDAELAVGGGVTPVADDLAVDGVDEVLRIMLGYLSREWPKAFEDLPERGEAPAVRVVAGGRSWLLTPTPTGVTVGSGGTADGAATLSGDPQAVLLWLWGRQPAPVAVTGDRAAVTRLRGLLREATQ
jgi:uncharacterized protein (TIGR03083 family)